MSAYGHKLVHVSEKKYQTFTSIMNCSDSPLTSPSPDSGIICSKFRANNITHPEFLSHFWKQQEDSVMMSAST
jgi:hypothetical protein